MHGNMLHGHTGRYKKQSGAYRSWAQMRGRCLLKSNPDFLRYGAKGISICERWLKFSAFYEDMGDRPEGKSIDRIDGTKGYSPENCRWATCIEQNKNRKTNHYVEYEGKRMCVSDWAKYLGISKVTLGARLGRYGWTIEEAFTIPVDYSNGLRHRKTS